MRFIETEYYPVETREMEFFLCLFVVFFFFFTVWSFEEDDLSLSFKIINFALSNAHKNVSTLLN